MSSNAINSEPSNSAQDVNDHASSEPGSSSWKSKAVLAAGLGVPIGVFLAASPAAAQPDFATDADYVAFSGTGALGPVESAGFADATSPDMFDFSLDPIYANTFQVVDSKAVQLAEPAPEPSRADVDLVNPSGLNYVAIDSATGGSVMGDSELAPAAEFDVDVFDTVAWLDGQNDAQSVPVTESAFAQSPESPAAVASAEANEKEPEGFWQALLAMNDKLVVVDGKELETVEAGVPLFWLGGTAAAAAIGTAATMEAVDNTQPTSVSLPSATESALPGITGMDSTQDSDTSKAPWIEFIGPRGLILPRLSGAFSNIMNSENGEGDEPPDLPQEAKSLVGQAQQAVDSQGMTLEEVAAQARWQVAADVYREWFTSQAGGGDDLNEPPE